MHVGGHLVLRDGLLERDRVALVREEVHGRRAAELEVLGTDLVGDFQRQVVEQHEQLQRLAHARQRRLVQPPDVHELELVREAEILLQQPVPQVRGGRVLEQALVGREPDRLHALGPAQHRRSIQVGRRLARAARAGRVARAAPLAASGPPARAGRPHQHAQRIAQQQLVKAVHQRRLAVEEEAQDAQRQVAEVLRAQGAQAQAQRRGRARRQAGLAAAEGHDVGARQLDRPERHGVGGAEPAADAPDGAGVQQRVARHADAGGRLGPVGVGRELDDGGARHRRQVVRVQGVQQRLGQLRELVVQAQLHAGRQHGERLDQALDVRVLALVGLQQQLPGHGGVAGGELRRQPADEPQLPLVVSQQAVPHQSVASICTAPLLSSMLVS